MTALTDPTSDIRTTPTEPLDDPEPYQRLLTSANGLLDRLSQWIADVTHDPEP